jgi:hypothetical protein
MLVSKDYEDVMTAISRQSRVPRMPLGNRLERTVETATHRRFGIIHNFQIIQIGMNTCDMAGMERRERELSRRNQRWLQRRTAPLSTESAPIDRAVYQLLHLLDLRAGVEHNTWRFQLWGRNVTNRYCWTVADHVIDVLVGYTGMPATYGFTVSYKLH